MDHRQPHSRANYHYGYPQQQQSQYSQHQQMPPYASESHPRNGFAPPLQPINTQHGMYPQADQLRSSSSSASYQPSASIPISPGAYAQNMAYSQERQTVPHPPPSPSQSDSQEEEEYRNRIPGPPPEMHEFQGRKYGLKITQEPIRARMCGFGDKDRRPITTPPIVQAVIYDAATDTEIDYENCDFELSHFVVQVHIFDIHGLVEKSIVKTAPGQQIISATLASGYPSTSISLPQSPNRAASRVPREDPSYASVHSRHPSLNGQFGQPYNPSPYHNGANTSGGSMFPSVLPPPSNYNSMNGGSYGAYGNYPRHSTNIHAPGNAMPPTGPNQPPTPPLSKSEEAGPGYSRNLIGANTMSGQLLQDENDRWGIFFAFTDLSVRSEDWFRLKFTLFNVGDTVTGLSQEQLLKMAEENNSAPNTISTEAGRSNNRRLDGLRAGLIAKTAPCLATVYSQGFKVYSAKKFPGVAEGTDISRKFAKQGVKISVRKESKTGDKRKRGDDDDDEFPSDGEE